MSIQVQVVSEAATFRLLEYVMPQIKDDDGNLKYELLHVKSIVDLDNRPLILGLSKVNFISSWLVRFSGARYVLIDDTKYLPRFRITRAVYRVGSRSQGVLKEPLSVQDLTRVLKVLAGS